MTTENKQTSAAPIVKTPTFIQKEIEFNLEVVDYKTSKIKFEKYLILNNIVDQDINRALFVDSLAPKPLQTLISLCRPCFYKRNSQRIVFKTTNAYTT